MLLKPARRAVALAPLTVAACLAHTGLAQAEPEPEPIVLDEAVITSTRTGTERASSPQVVSVISREQIEQQLRLTSDSSQILSNLLPAYSPNRQKLTSSGETFRGRTALLLIDGVPQSNPLRDSKRSGHTIDLSMVERIEVIHGANAIHGLGATGGIINFITRRPGADRLRQHLDLQVSAPTDHADRDSLGFKTSYRVEGSHDNLEFLLGLSYENQGIYKDADGTLVGVDTTQGELMDSEAKDLFVKLGYWLDERQNIEFEHNRYYADGGMHYDSLSGDRANGVPTTSVKQRPAGRAPRNRVQTSSLSYHHDDLLGLRLDAQAYSQRFEGRFGAALSATFQDPSIAPVGTLSDQSQNESDKLGAKISLQKADLWEQRLKLTGGLDLLRDTTQQRLVLTGRSWVPETQFSNYAPFLQAQLKPAAGLVLHGGVRYEHAELEVDSFQTLASANGVRVEGGNPSFNETLHNLGLVYSPVAGISLFANYAEGFGMPDVGRVLRGINQPDQEVDEFLNLRPIVTDNREIGVRFDYRPVDLALSYYRSDSDLGSRLQNVGGIYFVKREKTEITGIEARLGLQLSAAQRLELAYAHIEGEYDSDGDNRVDSRLDGLNIAPNRLLASWEARWSDRLQTRLQASHSFERDFDNPAKRFDGYTLVDASLGYGLPVGTLSLSVANLLNQDYVTYYSQSAVVDDDRYFKGRGRTLTLGYGVDF